MPAATLYGVELEIGLGLGHAAGAAVWDTGRWDVEAWAQTDTSLGDWVDVTCSVLDDPGVELAAGASDADGVVTRWEAATLAFVLAGDLWDPWSGPWAGLIGPGTPVRLRWRPTAGTWQVAFLGAVDAAGYAYTPDPDPRRARARLQAVDATLILTQADGLEQAAQGQGETAAQRVGRVLDTALWPADARDVTAGGVAVKETTLADVAWTELLAVADTDLALMWVRRDGRLAYRPQGRTGRGVTLPGITLVVCPDDHPGGVQVVTLERGQGDIRNIVSVSRQKREGDPEPSTATVVDEPSRARFGPRRYQRTDLVHVDDAWSAQVATVIVLAGAWPVTAPRVVTLDSRLGDPRVPQLLLTLEPEHAMDLNDGARVWQVGPVGWRVTASRSHIAGSVALDDWSRWSGSGWDLAVWDRDPWGVN